jgi:hypothetical protein
MTNEEYAKKLEWDVNNAGKAPDPNYEFKPIGGISFCTAVEGSAEDSILKHVFERLDYHAPSSAQIPKYQAIRDAAKAFATVIVRNCPGGTDRAYALGMLEMLVMQANKSIALEERG